MNITEFLKIFIVKNILNSLWDILKLNILSALIQNETTKFVNSKVISLSCFDSERHQCNRIIFSGQFSLQNYINPLFLLSK